MKYILASGSPRRFELLKTIIADFVVRPADSDESFDPATPPAEAVSMLALRKAEAVARTVGGTAAVIGADTLVYKDGRFFGKPAGRGEAFSALKTLSGSPHEVYTGVAVVVGAQKICRCQKTTVTIGVISDETIYNYIDACAPFDKAGGYGIQDITDFAAVSFEGDYQNVLGLPVELTKEILKEAADWPLWK
ncbi:MAG: Maf family protein, partial [Clostridiales bacterium]|nr:Maf family protein [Clostridiales bacterium]